MLGCKNYNEQNNKTTITLRIRLVYTHLFGRRNMYVGNTYYQNDL